MFGPLVARLFQFAWSIIAPAAAVTARSGVVGAVQRGGLILSAGAVATDLLNIDILRREAVKVAPNSDPEALEEAARQIMRMTGADGSDVLFPRNGTPNYYVFDLRTGRAWFTTQYRSSKSVRAAMRRGAARGFGRGQRNIATISQAQRG